MITHSEGRPSESSEGLPPTVMVAPKIIFLSLYGEVNRVSMGKIKKLGFIKPSFFVGTAKGSYAYCFAIRRPAAPFQVALDHSLFGSPPDFLIYARALSGSTP